MISIIIPVYNVKPYLDDCLQSVVGQDYTDFECILVDDGSTDGSSELCDQWVEKDTRIQVIHQTNQGVSSARNRGLAQAKGEYISFIDSDDWVNADYLSTMACRLKKGKADLAVCGLTQELKDGSSKHYIASQSLTFELTGRHAEQFVMLNERHLLYGPVVKLYKNEIIQRHQIQFDPQVSYGEDLLFNYQYLEHVHTITCIDKSLYHYRILGSGTLSSKLRPDQFDTDYRQWKMLRSFYRRHKLWLPVSQAYMYKRLWGIVYDGLFLYPHLPDKNVAYLRTILSIPEIDDLTLFTSIFSCSSWIKKAIIHRLSLIFYIYFLIQSKK